MRSIHKHITGLLITFVAACGGEFEEGGFEEGGFEEGEVATTEEAIVAGTDVTASSPFRLSTVAVTTSDGTFRICTGTIITRRHVLTAAHCGIVNGNKVRFYGNAFPNNQSRSVIAVYQPFGVAMGGPLLDTAGKFADFSVLLLDSEIPSEFRPAALATIWPGNWVSMSQVGTGNHDGTVNSMTMVMRQRSTNSYSASDANGHVLVEAVTDPGDSGGPIYTTNSDGTLTVFGDDYGDAYEWAWHGKYTSCHSLIVFDDEYLDHCSHPLI